MGILNVTPDSFSDGGKFFDTRSSVRRAIEMAREGADIIDVGGESTRPGSFAVSLQEELDRVMPVIRSLRRKLDVPLSIDTRKAAVARAALEEGVGIVNDVSGLRHDALMAKVIRRFSAAVILMHMKGSPADMQKAPAYRDVMAEVIAGLKASVALAAAAGIKDSQMIVDPGIGFGKTFTHNLMILNRLDELTVLRKPVCAGVSRKAFLGKILKAPSPADRIFGTAAANAVALMKGASIIRVHDVKEAKATALVVDRIKKESMAG